MLRTNPGPSPKPRTPKQVKLQTLQQRRAEIKQRLEHISDQLIQEQNYYKMFGVDMWKGEAFTIVQSEQVITKKTTETNNTLQHWTRMVNKFYKDAFKKNYAAWLIQSAWRSANGKTEINPPDLTEYFELTYPIICKAELRAIHQIADGLLEESLNQIIEPKTQEEEEEYEEDGVE